MENKNKTTQVLELERASDYHALEGDALLSQYDYLVAQLGLDYRDSQAMSLLDELFEVKKALDDNSRILARIEKRLTEEQ